MFDILSLIFRYLFILLIYLFMFGIIRMIYLDIGDPEAILHYRYLSKINQSEGTSCPFNVEESYP